MSIEWNRPHRAACRRARSSLPLVALGAVCVLALAGAGAAVGEPPAEAAASSQAAHAAAHPAGPAARLLRDEPSPVRSLDPAIFTDLSPVAASDPAVRLPPDQRLEPSER